VAPLKEKGKLVSHSKEKAQILIKQFSSVFTRGSVDNMPETHINLSRWFIMFLHIIFSRSLLGTDVSETGL
jgi:hypothetical protein